MTLLGVRNYGGRLLCWRRARLLCWLVLCDFGLPLLPFGLPNHMHEYMPVHAPSSHALNATRLAHCQAVYSWLGMLRTRSMAAGTTLH